MNNLNSIPSVNYRGNYPGQQSYVETHFDEEYDSSESEISFLATRLDSLDKAKTSTKTKTYNERNREKAKRYYIQSTLEVNIDHQYPVDNIEIYREKIFPFQLTPNISLVGPEESDFKRSRLSTIWKSLSNSEPSIIGIVRGKGFVYTIPETIDLLLYILVCFGFVVGVLFFNSSGNVKHVIHNMLSYQTFSYQSSLGSECLGLPDKNGTSSYDLLYSKHFKQYISTPDKGFFYSTMNNNVVFPCGRGTISNVATIADYLRWIALVLFPSFVDFRGTLNSALTSQIRVTTQFNNGTESELEYVHEKGVLKGNNIYMYPYDVESMLDFLDIIVKMGYFNKTEVSGIDTRFFVYNPYVGVKTSVTVSLQSSLITGYYNSDLDVRSLLVKTNSYSFVFMAIALLSGFFGFFRLSTHKDAIKSPLITMKSSMNRMFALLSSILLIISVVGYMLMFVPTKWLWMDDVSLKYADLLQLHQDGLDANFLEQSNHFEYLAVCDTLFRIAGSASLIFTLWEFFWFISVKISRKADEIWVLVNESKVHTGMFFIPVICIFGIILPSYVYALFCHIYNSTIDTVEWCWDNCTRDMETKINSSPWYIEESSLYDRDSRDTRSLGPGEGSLKNKGNSDEIGISNNAQASDLLFVRNRYSDFMAQSTAFERFYDILFSKKKYLTTKQKKEIEMSKFDSYEQTRKIAELQSKNTNRLGKTIGQVNSNNFNDGREIIRQGTNEYLQGNEYGTLVTRSINEYYWSIFNSGKNIFSNPGTISNFGNNISSTSQQLMYRMVGAMEASVETNQFISPMGRESDYSSSIGLNDQNGLPLLVGNVMAASPCPNMESLLTFTEKVNRVGESVWFGILLILILVALIASSALEFRGGVYGNQINSVSWNQFYTDVNINMMKPIGTSNKSETLDSDNPTNFILNSVKLNLLASETPNEISYWISMASLRLLFNTSSEFQYKTLFPKIKDAISPPNIMFNQNLLYSIDANVGVLLRAVSITESISAEHYINGTKSADDLFRQYKITDRFPALYSDNDKKLSEELNMKLVNKSVNGYPHFYSKLIATNNYSTYFEDIYSSIYKLLHYPKLVYLEVLLPSLLLEDQMFNYVRIIITRDISGGLNKEPLNVLLNLNDDYISTYLEISLEILISLLTIGYLVVFSLECKKFIRMFRNSPESTGRKDRSAIFCFFNYMFTDLTRAHDLIIVIMIIIRFSVFLAIFYYKMELFKLHVDTSDFDMVYELSISLSYINTVTIWIFVLRLFGQFSSISSNFRFLTYSYKRSFLPLLLIFIFLALQFIGMLMIIFINFSSCNDEYSTLFGVVSSTMNLFTGNFDFSLAYKCSSNITTIVLLPLLIAIYYVIMPVHTVVILRSLWLSKKESTDIDRIFKIVIEGKNKKDSDEYRKYIKHITGMDSEISEREIWDNAGIDYDEDDPIDRKTYEKKYEKNVSKVEIHPPKIAELTDEQWEASPDFIKEWAEYEAESFIDRFRTLESEFKMNTSSTGYYSKFVSKWESSVYKELQLLEVTTNEAEQLLKRLQRAIKGTANRVRISQALQTNNLEAAIREKEEERESKRALLKARKNKSLFDNN
ncbi:putative membrane protein [Cryptosporidium canis]|uniref:Membrane protein n=1 Tax=Cryptosporidium canis TaxID=195482 RepID=A0A9D5DLQ6_9CRYT|nr:putative membrane protein [Cryptosporidium canis]